MGMCQATDNGQERSQGQLSYEHYNDVLKNKQYQTQSDSTACKPIRKLSSQDISRKSENIDSTGSKEQHDIDRDTTAFTTTNTCKSQQNQQEFEKKKFSLLYRIITQDQMIYESIKTQSGLLSRSSQQSLKNIYYLCHYCQIFIEKKIIQLPCQHSYHIDCLMEILVKQINNHSYNLICLCNKQINLNIFMQFQNGEKMKEAFLNNQLNQLFLNEEKKNSGIRYCKKCKFIYIEKNKSTDCKCVYKK